MTYQQQGEAEDSEELSEHDGICGVDEFIAARWERGMKNWYGPYGIRH